MQERRSTVRVNVRSRAQYCPIEDLLPRDGRITNLSERGVGLLVQEPHRDGEQITVNFSLPGDEDPLTATGVVRWSAPPTSKSRWHPLGLEWLPLEESIRTRLQRFLYRGSWSSPDTEIASPRSTTQEPMVQRMTWTVVGILALFAIGLLGSWVFSIERENREMDTAIQHRNVVIHRLQRAEDTLRQELGSAKAHLASAAAEVARLDQATHELGGEAERLTQDVVFFQHSYALAREERDELMQRVLDLEQERLALSQRLSSVPELRRAIRDAVTLRRKAEETERRARIHALRELERHQLANGNRGYLTREGRQTAVTPSTVWIKVHDPAESVP